MNQPHGSNPHAQQQPPIDPFTAFWRDVWAKAGAPAPGQQPGFPGIPAMPQGFPGFISPEVARRMQAAFFDAMAQYADQYMRSPEFLESMKKSMDQALQLRRQMDDFLKANLASTMAPISTGANAEILDAIRRTESMLKQELSELRSRLDRLESARSGNRASPASPAKKTRKRA